jgi:hypothetical protein
MEMNKEKVIKGLEHCLSESEHIDDNPCKGCPYFVSDQYGCERTQMEKDALALLREQDELLKHEYWRGYNNGRADERGLQEGTIMQTFSPD